MPYLCTHIAFGARIASALGASIESFGESYVLGCLGPDVYFFDRLPPTPFIPHQKKHGNALHTQDAAVLFRALQNAAPADLHPFLKGFLTHIALDSTLHPYVEARHTGLDHTRFEGVIDSMIYADTCNEIDYRRLLKNDADVSAIDLLLADVSQTLYGKNVRGAYRRSVRKFRRIFPFLFDPKGRRYRVLNCAERGIRRNGLLSAFLLAAPRDDCEDAMNLSRAPWAAPWAPERIRNESVPMLLSEAQALAVELIVAFEADDRAALDRLLSNRTMQRGVLL